MKTFRYIILVFVFFPSVTFGLLSAEIFPWAILFAAISLRYVNKADAIVTTPLIIGLALSAVWFGTFGETDALRSFLAYLNPIAAYVAFMNLSTIWVARSLRLAQYILVFLVVLGLGQFLGLLAPLEGFLQFLVPRASGSVLAEMGGRGVTLLSSEPSRAGTEFVFLYLIYRLLHRPEDGLGLRDLAALLFLVVVVRAAQPVAFGAFAIGLFAVRKPTDAIMLGMVVLFAPVLSIGFGDSRFISLFERAFQQGSMSNALFFVANESGHRLLSIYAFFKFGLTHPFGGGVGMWSITSVQAIEETGIDITHFRYFQLRGDGDLIGVRGSGVLTNLMLDVGMVGSAYFLYWIFRLAKRLVGRDATAARVMLVLLIKITFVGSIGEPIPWVATALILHSLAVRRQDGSSHSLR